MADFDVVPVRGGCYAVQKVDRYRGRRHERFSAAEEAAARLVEANPGQAFVITQEVALVRRHEPRSAAR